MCHHGHHRHHHERPATGRTRQTLTQPGDHRGLGNCQRATGAEGTQHHRCLQVRPHGDPRQTEGQGIDRPVGHDNPRRKREGSPHKHVARTKTHGSGCSARGNALHRPQDGGHHHGCAHHRPSDNKSCEIRTHRPDNHDQPSSTDHRNNGGDGDDVSSTPTLRRNGGGRDSHQRTVADQQGPSLPLSQRSMMSLNPLAPRYTCRTLTSSSCVFVPL